MWTEKDSIQGELCNALAKYIHENPHLANLYRAGKKEECYTQAMVRCDSTVQNCFDEYEAMKKKLSSLGLLREQFAETFCSWIKDDVANPDPDKLWEYRNVIGDRFVQVFDNELETDFRALDIWGIVQVTEDGVPYEEDLKELIISEYRGVLDEVAKLLTQG